MLICPALNRDALDSHHSLCWLADAFAAAGYPVLRFDYPGTGDSLAAGGDRPEHWAAWQASAQEAADFLRQQTGAGKLILLGLRFGALVAAHAAAAREDVAGLILLAPVLRGPSYLRQLWMEAQLQGAVVRPLQEGLEFHDLAFSPETIHAISRVDLRQTPLPDLEIAVFSPSGSNVLQACISAWRAQGARVVSDGFGALEPLLEHNLHAGERVADFSALLAWAHFERGTDGFADLLHVVGIDQQRVVQLARGAGESAEDEDAVIHAPGCQILLGDEVHAVVERRHQADIGGAVIALHFFVAALALDELDGFPSRGFEFAVDSLDCFFHLDTQIDVAGNARTAGRGDLDENDFFQVPRMLFEKKLKGQQALDNALSVVHAIDAQQHLFVVETEFTAKVGQIQLALRLGAAVAGGAHDLRPVGGRLRHG